MKSVFSRSMSRTMLKRGLGFIAIIAMGCASASISPQKSSAPIQASRPQRIYVRNFAVVAEDVKESHGLISQGERKLSSTPEEQREMDIGHAAATELSGRLSKDLQELGFIVDTQTGEVPVTGDVLLIEGQFVKVDEGAAGRRVMIGFGAGQSTLDSQVQVYRIAGGERQKLLTFTTHADSGKLPGTALMMGAGAAATGGVTVAGAAAAGGVAGGKVYLGRVDYLADKTADQAKAYLSQYFAKQGWISADQAQSQTVNLARETRPDRIAEQGQHALRIR
jgi:hypothetical protein